MKTIVKLLTLALILSALNSPRSTLLAQGTAFTYQGRLNNGTNPANGTYDLTFTLFGASSGGSAVAGPLTNTATAVSNGLFTVMLDFGNQFPGTDRWLEIGVRTNGANAFTTLAPRQHLTPTPYAIYAESANSLGGTLPASQLNSIGNTNGGIGNFFVGPSGNATTSGSDNTANGVAALSSNTNGYDNTANGYQTLYLNTSGTRNMANGALALSANTSGGSNTASGAYALNANTSGSFNTANGFGALLFNTTGSGNTANGVEALLAYNTHSLKMGIGWYNTANGYQALFSNTNGWCNTADGVAALYSNTSGSNNIALGYNAGYNIATGSGNIDIGNQGLATDANIIRIGSGQTQTIIAGVISGDGGGLSNLTASVSLLTSIGNTNGGSDNFFVGPSGNATTSGSDNTANGVAALSSNTGGSENTANGKGALHFNTSGWYNTANGAGALLSNTSGSDNTANGYQALFSNGGSDNTANGYFALRGNVSGSNNTANGSSALYLNTIGSGNTANGYFALYYNTSGSVNTADGLGALLFNTSGSSNIALGYLAGFNITTGSGNIDIGNPGLATDTNIIRIGSGQTQTIIAGVISGDGGDLSNLTASALVSIGNINGLGNFFVGPSGNATTSGINNTANGFGALSSNTSGSDNTANGSFALHFTASGSENTADGNQALYSNTSGYDNTANGSSALYFNTSGYDNTADGYRALFLNTSGWNNIALGFAAGFNITTGSGNIDIGNPGLATDTNIIRIGSGQTQTIIAGVISGDGGGLTNLNVSQALNITNGGGLTNLNASQLTSGTVPDARLSSNVALRSSANTFSGNQIITNGNVGIGTSSPGFPLNFPNTVGDKISLFGNSGPHFGFGIQNSLLQIHTDNSVGDIAFGYGSSASLTETMRIRGNGNIGLGVATPNFPLSFSDSLGDKIELWGSSGNGGSHYGFGIQANKLQIHTLAAEDNVVFGYGQSTNLTETMRIQGNGNVGIGTNNPQAALHVVGNIVATGSVTANGVLLTSDRNVKENFQPISPADVLDKVAALPIEQWTFKADTATRHIGPMAQDFYNSFGVGPDDTHISMVDEGGVALAAIQGLNQKLEQKIEQKETEITELKAELNELKNLVHAMNHKSN